MAARPRRKPQNAAATPRPLEGRVVLVTGAAGGIGLGICQVLLEQGATVEMADVDAVTGEAQAQQLGAGFHTLDVADAPAFAAVVEAVHRRHSALHGLVNNAGVIGPATLWDTAQLERVVAVNLHGVFVGMQQALRFMVPAGGGSIVNVSSINGVRGTTGAPMYAATKRAVVSLTRHAAVQHGPHGVRINALLPGNVMTHMLQRSYPSAQLRVALAQVTPLRRLGHIRQAGLAAAFLLGDASAFVTGHALAVDGGSLAALEVAG